MSTLVVFFVLPTIDVDNSGSRRDVDIHINIQIRDTIVIAPGAPGKTSNIVQLKQEKR